MSSRTVDPRHYRSRVRSGLRLFTQDVLMHGTIWTLCDVHVHHRELLDTVEAPFIVVANHSSHLDAPLVFGALPHRLSKHLAAGAAADYFFKNKVKGTATSLFFNAYPVERKGVRTRKGITGQLLDEGIPLLIFPEGTRSRTGAIGHFTPGVAALSISHGIPVLPVALVGAHAAWPVHRALPPTDRPAIHVVFGHPLTPIPGEIAHQFADRMRRIVAELHDGVARAYKMPTLADYERTVVLSQASASELELAPDVPAIGPGAPTPPALTAPPEPPGRESRGASPSAPTAPGSGGPERGDGNKRRGAGRRWGRKATARDEPVDLRDDQVAPAVPVAPATPAGGGASLRADAQTDGPTGPRAHVRAGLRTDAQTDGPTGPRAHVRAGLRADAQTDGPTGPQRGQPAPAPALDQFALLRHPVRGPQRGQPAPAPAHRPAHHGEPPPPQTDRAGHPTAGESAPAPETVTPATGRHRPRPDRTAPETGPHDRKAAPREDSASPWETEGEIPTHRIRRHGPRAHAAEGASRKGHHAEPPPPDARDR